MEMPNIEYRGNIGKTMSASDNYYQEISYFKTLEDFVDDTSYSKFIREVEKMVRGSKDYKVFVDYIKNTLGIGFCQVFSQVYDKVDANVEFHHGPIFTLYDICEVALTKFIRTGTRINTFRVADDVLQLHFDMKVNGVILSKTVHEMAHNEDIFLNINQSIGDVNAYIQDNARYFTPEVRYKLWTYAKMCRENPSFDKGALDLDVVKSYIKVSDGQS